MPNTVSIKIRIDDEGTFKKVQVDADDLKKAVGEVTRETERLKASIVNWAEAAKAADLFGDAISQLHGMLEQLTSAYSEQSSAETRLAQAMRNTMGASDEEIESIKRLCSEQQRIGIVGDEVQLAAAQELATYLTLSSSLKTIIPVMNDMIAQQLGLGASAESATQIATMLGKVMDGQTEALSRYGYKFDDAQKYILKFGEEEEKAAVLAELVEQSVAGMNEALASTPAGRMQQVANSIGDIKEKLGAIAKDIMPVVSGIAELGMAASAVSKLSSSIKALTTSTAAAKIESLGLAAAERLQAAAARLLGISALEAKTATGALKVEIIATEAAITLGLSLAISALVELFARLIGRSKGASDSIDGVGDAVNAYKQAAAEARAETAKDIVELEDLIKQKGEEGKKIDELNRKYGEAFGTYSSAADWYDILTSKSEEYCRQLAYEAMAAQYKDELAEALKAQQAADERARQAMAVPLNPKNLNNRAARERHAALAAAREAGERVDELTTKMAEASAKAAELGKSIRDGLAEDEEPWYEMSLADLQKAIKTQKALVESLAGKSASAAEAKAQAGVLAKMEARAARLQKLYGLDTSGDKDKYSGDQLFENAQSYLEAGNNVKYYNREIEKADASDTEHIKTLIAKRDEWQRTQDEIKKTFDALGRPVSLENLEDIDKELKYQQSLLQGEKDPGRRAAINAEIERLNDLKTAFELASYTPLKEEEIKTFQQLEKEIQYYTALVNISAGADREAAQMALNARARLKDSWQAELDMLNAPTGQQNTIKDIGDALSFYQSLSRRQQGDELSGTYRTIEALQRKQRLLERLASIPEMQREIAELDSLSGKQLKIELDLVGLDGVRGKIRDLKKLLQDVSLTEAQRKDVDELIKAYSKYESRIRRSNLSLSESWATVRGLGNSIESLSEALKEDGLSWQKLGSIVDSTLGIYEAVNGIVQIVKALTGASQAHTAAKVAEAGAEGAEAAANATASATNVASSAATQTAVTLETEAWKALAAAKAYATYAAVPGGQAIADAYIAQMNVAVALQRIIPFANGGIVYGPTLGLFGEYAGAAQNPEVIAPLDKLKSLLDSGPSFPKGPIELRARGRDLVGVINYEYSIRKRG